MDPFRIVTELMEGGSLKHYLVSHESIEIVVKLNWMRDIAKGMEHLIRNGIVHRDLAARNVSVLYRN
jgi:serine/threonine protein kinase